MPAMTTPAATEDDAHIDAFADALWLDDALAEKVGEVLSKFATDGNVEIFTVETVIGGSERVRVGIVVVNVKVGTHLKSQSRKTVIDSGC